MGISHSYFLLLIKKMDCGELEPNLQILKYVFAL
jgi:hypothetical protein